MANHNGLLSINFGLLWGCGMAAFRFLLLGFPGGFANQVGVVLQWRLSSMAVIGVPRYCGSLYEVPAVWEPRLRPISGGEFCRKDEVTERGLEAQLGSSQAGPRKNSMNPFWRLQGP